MLSGDESYPDEVTSGTTEGRAYAHPLSNAFDALRLTLGKVGIAEPTRGPDGRLRADTYRTLDTIDAIRHALGPFSVPVTSGEEEARAERAELIQSGGRT